MRLEPTAVEGIFMRACVDDKIDDDSEIPLSKARFPGSPHIATVWRWVTHGVTRNGQTIKLRVIRCGGRTFVKQSWADEFVAACNADSPASQPTAAQVLGNRKRNAIAAQSVALAGAR